MSSSEDWQSPLDSGRQLAAYAEELRSLREQMQSYSAALRAAQEQMIKERQRRAQAEAAQRENEARLRAAMEASLDALFFLSCHHGQAGQIVDFFLVDLNSRAAALLATSHPSPSGQLLGDLLPPEPRDQLLDEYRRVVTTGEPSEREFLLPRPPHAERWIRQQVVRLPKGLAVSWRDISAQKRDELALRALNTRLAQSNRELREFASVASHDLQEPLRKIIAFSDRLSTRFAHALDAEAQDYLRRVQHAARRMQTLIDDLLAFARISTREQPFVPVDLGAVAADVLADLEAQIERSRGRVDLEPLPTVEADPLQMRQLLQNLLGNALKFHRPEEPPQVRLSAQALGDNLVELRVADQGIGFDEKYLDRIFTVFQRLHGRSSYEGNGIGLAICQRIVDRHGGTLRARSSPGAGATFFVSLPVRQNERTSQ